MTLWELIKKGAEEGLEALKDGVSVFMEEMVFVLCGVVF